MTVNFYVIGPFMEYRVLNAVDSKAIIAIQVCCLRMMDAKIMQEVQKPLNFTVGESKSMILPSEELRETVGCFLDFQEIRESPEKTQNPVIERRKL